MSGMSGGRAAIDVIAFDADDTLWHNESLYTRAQTQFQELLATYNGDDGVAENGTNGAAKLVPVRTA